MVTSEGSGRRDRKRHQMLDHLAKTAVSLFDVYGFDAVTMEQIATEADVAKGTLYNHFPIKEAVLAHWIHLELAGDLKHLFADADPHAGFVSGITHILEASADWCELHRAYLPPYLRFRFLDMSTTAPEEGRSNSSDLAGAFGLLILKSQEAGELRSDLSAEHLAMMFHHLYLGAMLRWLTVPGLKLREEFANAVGLFVDGAALSSSPKRKHRKSS